MIQAAYILIVFLLAIAMASCSTPRQILALT